MHAYPVSEPYALPPMPGPDLAEHIGHWSARHKKTAMFGWLAFVVVAITLGSLIPRAELTRAESEIGPPAQAQRILDAHGWKEPVSEMVLVSVEAPRPVEDEPLVLSRD